MSELYDNLLKATDNTNDITTEKYAIITKINGNICSAKEIDSDLEHSNVPIMNGADIKLGDKVIIGFLNNSIYDIVCYGVLDRTVEINWENVKDKPSTFPPSRHNHVSSEVTDLINTIYPVGSIYMSVISTSPQILFGGTWEQIKDTFLLASGDTYASDGDVATAQHGSATVSLTEEQMPRHTHIQDSHNHTQNSHNHTQNAHSHGTKYDNSSYVVKEDSTGATNKRVTAVSSGSTYVDTASTAKFHNYNATKSVTATNNSATATNQSATATNKFTGGTNSTEAAQNGSAHENMPPYMAVYCWKRTA